MADVGDVADKIQEQTQRSAAIARVLGVFEVAPGLDELMMAYLDATLAVSRGNQTQAARRLRITRWRLRRLLARREAT